MPGWNLKSGELLGSDVSEEELWSLFNYVFSDSCRKTNTYKFGLIKAICDQIYDLTCVGLGYPLSYEKIFYKFTENYWNLVNRYKLKQMSYNGKSDLSKIEKIISAAVEDHELSGSITFQALIEPERARIVRIVTQECKRNVIGALYNDFQGKLYGFDLKGDGIVLGQASYDFISKYKMEIEKLNYYHWARFLEKVNDDDALVRVLEKLELATPQRKDLSLYRDILFMEFQQNRCFHCGKRLSESIHVDHFIPWSFVMNDELWNLMPMDSSLNSAKSNRLPKWNPFFEVFAGNQYLMYEMINERPDLHKRFEACYRDNLHSIWAGQELYRKGNSREVFYNILERNMMPVYDSARRQGYEIWNYG